MPTEEIENQSDYEKLELNFHLAVVRLQNKCRHEKSTWSEEWIRIASATGRELLICDNCQKVLDTRGKNVFKRLG